MWPNPQETLNGKLHFLCSDISILLGKDYDLEEEITCLMK